MTREETRNSLEKGRRVSEGWKMLVSLGEINRKGWTRGDRLLHVDCCEDTGAVMATVDVQLPSDCSLHISFPRWALVGGLPT